MQVGGVAPGVERAPDRRRGEAEDRGAAGGLDVGEQRELGGQRRLQRTGGHGGEVGLQQHVVEGRGQERRQPADRVVGVAGEQRARRRGERPAAGDPEQLGLLEGPGDQLGAPPTATAGAVQSSRSTIEVGRRGADREAAGQLVEHRVPHLGRRRPLQVGSERGDHLVPLVAAAHGAGHPGRAEPRLGEGRPSGRRCRA